MIGHSSIEPIIGNWKLETLIIKHVVAERFGLNSKRLDWIGLVCRVVYCSFPKLNKLFETNEKLSVGAILLMGRFEFEF